MQQTEAMRRLGLTIAAALAIVGALASRAVAAPDLAAYVNPFNGTRAGAPNFGTGGGAGNTFPGPGVPFGMIQWGPDTSPSSDNAGGGYAYDDSQIRGVSLRRRSEERRVGEEGRTRWWPDHLKKKKKKMDEARLVIGNELRIVVLYQYT